MGGIVSTGAYLGTQQSSLSNKTNILTLLGLYQSLRQWEEKKVLRTTKQLQASSGNPVLDWYSIR